MLDTHIATDLIGDATFDVYDIALIVSEDSDFVPSVDFVQEMRNKQIVHVGFGGYRQRPAQQVPAPHRPRARPAVPAHAAGGQWRK